MRGGRAGAPLWRWPELCRALGLPECSGPDVMGFSIDSRRTVRGDLFIALPGDPGPRFHTSSRSERDGHDFVDDAMVRGAVGALVHKGVADHPLLRVEDTLDGLWALARARRKALAGPVVAVTGSSGKTTAKNLLGAALSAFITPGSLNNHLGVPLSIAATPAGTQAAVFEIGTNHPGEIGMLSQLVQPDIGVVLNVHPAHAEFFAGLDEIRKEKLSICKGLKSNSHLIVEQSIQRLEVPGQLRILTFGEGQGSHCRLVRHEGQRAWYRLHERELQARVPGGGRHRALTLAAVFCVLQALGKDVEDACHLPDSLVPDGRGNVRNVGGVALIDDSYNANPASMRAALTHLSNPNGRTVAVLGEMLELGAESAAHHEALASACARIDRIVGVGAGMQALWPKLPARQRWLWRRRADDALLRSLLAGLKSGDVVLIKGSNRVFWAEGFAAKLATALEQRGSIG